MKFPGASKRRGASQTQFADPRGFHANEHHQGHHIRRPQQQQNDRGRQSPQLTNEYEYVRREHGFDFMPPSRYVPSRSMSEDTDEYSEDPQIQLQMTESDLTAVEIEYEKNYIKPKATPVVRGKTIKGSPFKSRGKAVHRHASNDDQETRHRLQMKLVAEEFKQKNAKSHWYQASAGGRREPNLDEYNKRKQRGSGEYTQKKQHRNHANLEMDIPTAYSYTSEESRGSRTPKEPRYNMRPETGQDEVYRTRGKNTFQSVASPAHIPYRYGWTRSSRDVVVKDFSKPTFQNPVHATNSPGRVIATPREHRSDKQGRRDRRSHSLETRQPPPEVYIAPTLDVEPRRHREHGHEPTLTEPQFEMDRRRHGRRRDTEPPSEMEPRCRSRRRERDLEATPASGPYEEPEYHDHPRQEPADYRQYPSHILNNNNEKRRPGVLIRFMNTVRGERSKKGVPEHREWHHPGQYEQERSTYRRPPGSFETEVSPYYPPHRDDLLPDGAPYTFEDYENFAQGPMGPTRGHSSSPRQPPRRHKSKSPGRNHRSQTEPVPDRPRTPNRLLHQSSKPSHMEYTSNTPIVYATSPRVRGGPEHRQRATGHHVQYPIQNHGEARRINAKGGRSPGTLQFDGAQVRLGRDTQRKIYHP